MVGPFALLLAAIAVLPLVPATSHWWHSNLHRFYVAGGLAAITLAYYLLLHASVIEAHWPAPHAAWPSANGPNLAQTGEVLANAILNEYIPFIVLLWSLYTISGGIRIEGDLPAHPLTNAAFLAAGAVLASFIGTTGAAMLLIRPLLETNRQRKHVQHTVIFFIFIVCNCGGLLLPLGDPPLFLGYLMGVPFLWTAVLWKEWLLVNAALLVIYYVWDHFWCYPDERPADLARDETRVHRLRFGGLWPNAFLLLGVVLSVAWLDPAKTIPGTQLASVALSARKRAVGPGGLVVGPGQQPRAATEPLQLRRDSGSCRVVFRHFHLHAAGAANLGRRGAQAGPDRALAILLGLGQPVVGARQRPDLRGILPDGRLAHRNSRP